jgi:2-polyprenyl-3-methyl-5-hydroxy-6-metoxy-1,4-benzoquinol methylase
MWNLLNSRKKYSNANSLGNYRSCPICRSKKSKKIFELENFQFYLDSEEEPKQFSVKNNICLKCFAIYLNPVYSKKGLRVLFREAGQSHGVLESNVSDQITWLDKRGLLTKNSSILDVGCYEGAFLSKLPSYIKKYGVDIDKKAIETAQKRYAKDGSEFYHGAFESFEYKGNAPDTIVMFHVLEHLADPIAVLIKLKKISKSSTNLIIEVPIIEKGETNDINGFFSIQHATHFSKNSLKNCLIKSGWKIIEECSMKDYNGFRVNCIPELKIDLNTKIENLCREKDFVLYLDYLTSWYKSLKNVEEKIYNIKKLPFYIIWGAGAHTEFLYQTTSFFYNRTNSKFFIVDSDHTKHEGSWRGIKIFDPKILKMIAKDINWNDTGLLISSYGSQNIIKKAALELSVKESSILELYEKIVHY